MVFPTALSSFGDCIAIYMQIGVENNLHMSNKQVNVPKQNLSSADGAIKDIDPARQYKKRFNQIAFTVFMVWLMSFAIAMIFLRNDGQATKAGVFGDSFGAVNALFSGLAFAGVVIALIIQTDELREARLDRRDSLDSQKTMSKAQRQGTQVQAMGLRMDIEKGKGFRPADIHIDSIEYERLIREANYKFELDTIVSELFQWEPPNRDVFARRINLVRLLVKTAWELHVFKEDASEEAVIKKLHDAISEPSLHSLLNDKFLLLNFKQLHIDAPAPTGTGDYTGEFENQAYCKLTREAIVVLGFSVLSDTPS